MGIPSIAGNITGTIEIPLVWAYIRTVGGTIFRFSQADLALNDPSTYYGGRKSPRILSISPITRQFSDDGAIRAYTWTLLLEDTDGVLRGAAFSNTLRGGYVTLYLVDDVSRRALASPQYRIGGGIITGHKPLTGPKYELTITGLLGRTLSELNKEPRIPGHVLTATEFPGLDSARDGRPAPVCIGYLEPLAGFYDPLLPAGNAYVQGMVHAKFFGTLNLLSTFGGSAANINVDAYLLSEGAVKMVNLLSFSVRVWGNQEASRVGDVIKPTNPTATPFFFVCTTAGTSGTSEPTWNTGVGATTNDGSIVWTRGSAFDPLLRYEVPQSIYSQDIACPFQPLAGPDSFMAATGLSTKYIDYGGRRYTAFFIRNDHPFARACREGRITLSADVVGLTTNANGSGTVISDPAEVLQFILVNQVFTSSGWQSYSAMPQFTTPDGNLDYVDQTSVAAAKTVAQTIQPGAGGTIPIPAGYHVGMVLGGEQDQQRLFDFIRDVCHGSNLEVGENRFGQIMVSLENPSASAVDTFTVADIIDGSLEMEIEHERYVNKVVLRFGFRYTPDPFPGTPNETNNWINGFVSGYLAFQDTTAQAAVGEVVEYRMDNRLLRFYYYAQNVAQAYLDKFRGVIGYKDGPRRITFSTRWQGLGKTAALDLGSVIDLIMPPGDWLVGNFRYRIRLTEITVDALAGIVTLSGRLVAIAAV